MRAPHHSPLPASAYSAAAASTGAWLIRRPRMLHNGAWLSASRTAVSGSCSIAQSSAWRSVTSSASSCRRLAASPVRVYRPTEACSATSAAYPASAAVTSPSSPASASSPAP